VLRYYEQVLNKCSSLHDEYSSLAVPVHRSASDNEIISDTVNEEDIPEIHFPALGDGYAADELQPSLEPGFQMLHSLEQEEQIGRDEIFKCS